MILITGFHHSGTSFLARAIEQLGFNFGGSLDRHHEHERLKEIDDILIGDWQKPSFNELKRQVAIELPPDIEAYKNPRMMVTWPTWHRNFPDAKWICVTRNPADVVTSMMNDNTRSQDPEYWDALLLRYNSGFTGLFSATKNVLVIEYRTLCGYPELTAKRLAHFLGRPEGWSELADWIRKEAKFKTYEKLIPSSGDKG